MHLYSSKALCLQFYPHAIFLSSFRDRHFFDCIVYFIMQQIEGYKWLTLLLRIYWWEQRAQLFLGFSFLHFLFKFLVFFNLQNHVNLLEEKIIYILFLQYWCWARNSWCFLITSCVKVLLVFLWKVRHMFVAPNSCLCNWCDNCYGTCILYHTV